MGYANNASGADAGSDFTVYPLVLTASGKVGIGTAGPSYKLDVNGEINATGLRINGTPISTGGSQWSGSSNIYYNGGNVGVGTNAPSDLLEVNSTIGWGFRVRYAGDGQYLRVSANQLSAFTAAGTPKDLYLNTDGGNVGIGNSSPAEKLHVTGNISVTGTGNITATGTITGNIINAKYQDLAEWVPSSEHLSAGTVVVLDTTKSNQVISSITAYDTRVAGVITAQPGITLGEGGEGNVLVATLLLDIPPAAYSPLRIGEISKSGGGRFGEHRGVAHASGNGVDIGLFRNDRRNAGVNYTDTQNYNRNLTRALVEFLDAHPDVTRIIFNDPNITGTKLTRDTRHIHDNHIHVEFTPCVR